MKQIKNILILFNLMLIVGITCNASLLRRILPATSIQLSLRQSFQSFMQNGKNLACKLLSTVKKSETAVEKENISAINELPAKATDVVPTNMAAQQFFAIVKTKDIALIKELLGKGADYKSSVLPGGGTVYRYMKDELAHSRNTYNFKTLAINQEIIMAIEDQMRIEWVQKNGKIKNRFSYFLSIFK